MGADRGRDPLRIAARGHYRVTSGQSSLGDVCSHAASSTGNQPNCLLIKFLLPRPCRIPGR